MITSNMKDFERYCTNDDFKTAFDFLSNTDLDAFAMGKTVLNDRVFVVKSTYDTYTLGETFWEAHEEYIDIQYIHKGSEKLAYAPVDSLKTSFYYEGKDLKVLKGKIQTMIHLNSGEYSIFFPEDAHMPSLNPGDQPAEVTKFVVKIRV